MHIFGLKAAVELFAVKYMTSTHAFYQRLCSSHIVLFYFRNTFTFSNVIIYHKATKYVG